MARAPGWGLRFGHPLRREAKAAPPERRQLSTEADSRTRAHPFPRVAAGPGDAGGGGRAARTEHCDRADFGASCRRHHRSAGGSHAGAPHRAARGTPPCETALRAVLFTARAAIAFRFQSVGALSPLFAEECCAGPAHVGRLIGPAPRAGSCSPCLAARRPWLRPASRRSSPGRLIAGAGGVMPSVLMTGMVADRHSGREIAAATAICINASPTGVALPWAFRAMRARRRPARATPWRIPPASARRVLLGPAACDPREDGDHRPRRRHSFCRGPCRRVEQRLGRGRRRLSRPGRRDRQ